MQAVSKQNIDKWIRHNEWGIWDNLALKRENKPKPKLVKTKPVKSKVSPENLPEKRRIKPPWYQRDPEDWFKPIFRVLVWMHDHLLDIAKMAVACAIGVVLGLLFVWAW